MPNPITDCVEEMPTTKVNLPSTATLATAGGTVASILLWVATGLSTVQKDVSRLEAVQTGQAGQIAVNAARIARGEDSLEDLVKKSERVLAILEEMRRQDERDRGGSK